MKYGSMEEFIQRVAEDKERQKKVRSRGSFSEKLKVLVRLQEKAFFMGKTRFKPWPL
jgi:hypothetical protein